MIVVVIARLFGVPVHRFGIVVLIVVVVTFRSRSVHCSKLGFVCSVQNLGDLK